MYAEPHALLTSVPVQRDQLALFDEESVKGLDRNSANELPFPFAISRRVDRAVHFALLCERAVSRGPCDLHQAEEIALAGLEAHHSASPRTKAKAVQIIRRFFRYARARGVTWPRRGQPDLVEDFLWAATTRHGRLIDVSPTTASNRQSHLRTTFAILHDAGVMRTNPIGDSIARHPGERSRPLTSTSSTSSGPKPPGASSRPQPHCWSPSARPGVRQARWQRSSYPTWTSTRATSGSAGHEHGSTRSPHGVRSRSVVASSMARTRRLGHLCVRPDLETAGAAHSVTVRLRKLLSAAGLGASNGVAPRSIALTIAMALQLHDGIEAAARFLGNDSLDATARSLHYDWKSQ